MSADGRGASAKASANESREKTTGSLTRRDLPGSLRFGHAALQDPFEHREIDVSELVDVQALLEPALVLAQLLQELRLAVEVEHVDDQVGRPRTEADHARRARMPR